MLDKTVCSLFFINDSYYLWVTHTTTNGNVWYITSDKMRTEYQLWNGKKKTNHKATEPDKLYKYIKE